MVKISICFAAPLNVIFPSEAAPSTVKGRAAAAKEENFAQVMD